MIRPKVTIIVPVYNVEKYLTCCIGSILSQSFKDFELLLIDDGSSDLSGEICDDYVEKDARIRVFHKENGGVSSARNLGLENAQGEWICFIDSDDWVEVDFLKELIQYDSFDLVVGGCEGVGFLRKKIYTALLLQFLANLKRINSYSRFKQEIYAFNYGFTYILEIEIELNRIKRWAYWFIFKHTILGYYFIRLILTIKTILK